MKTLIAALALTLVISMNVMAQTETNDYPVTMYPPGSEEAQAAQIWAQKRAMLEDQLNHLRVDSHQAQGIKAEINVLDGLYLFSAYSKQVTIDEIAFQSYLDLRTALEIKLSFVNLDGPEFQSIKAEIKLLDESVIKKLQRKLL